MRPNWMEKLDYEASGLASYPRQQVKAMMAALRAITVVREIGGEGRNLHLRADPKKLREIGTFFLTLADEIDNLPPQVANLDDL